MAVAHQAPLSLGFSRQESWSGLPFPTPGDLADPGMEPRSHVSHLPHWQAGSLLLVPRGKPSEGPTFATLYCYLAAVMETFLMESFQPSAVEAVEIQRG